MESPGFNDYLALVARLLGTRAAMREAVARELSDHLEERLEELTAQGVSRQEAITRALEEFGDAVTLAARFTELARDTRRRRIMRWTIGSLACSMTLVVLAALLWPDPGHINVAVGAEGVAKASPKAAAAPAAKARSADPKPAAMTDEQRDAQVRDRLGQRITVEFAETPLSDAVDFLQQTLAAQIHVKWRKLEEAGVARDTAVSLRLQDTPADMILDLMLEEMNLDYTIDRGLLIISTAENLRSKLSVQVFNVQDLLPASPAKPAAEAGEGVPPTALEQLMELIRGHVAPTSWADNGGTGVLTPYEDLLIVTQTKKRAAEVELFLESLREARKTKAGSAKLAR